MRKRRTAAYKVIADSGGWTVRFYCDLSGELLCTEQHIRADSEDGAVEAAWENGGRAKFNPCERCGRWVSDVMYNADVHECVACAPWENPPHFCPWCGRRLTESGCYCPRCGKRLLYGGGEDL